MTSPSRRCLLAAAVLAAACSQAVAQGLTLSHPRARATLPGQPVAGGYLTLANPGPGPDRLVAARADDIARSVELHTMRMDGDVMRMRAVDAIDLPAGQVVELKPGGVHLMFMGLKAPLKAGERFSVRLRFERAGEQAVTMVVVDDPSAGPAPKP